MIESPSPFAKPAAGLPIKEGAPPITRPTREEVARFPEQAKALLESTWQQQRLLLEAGRYDLDWVKRRHFLIAGGTGPGLGGAIATALLHLLEPEGSLTVISRDLTKSVGYATGEAMQALAAHKGLARRFRWSNEGLALEGEGLERILSMIRDAGAEEVVYINTVAAANSGLLPGQPPVYIKDVDEQGLFQWQLTPLDERSIEGTKFVMGTMAVAFGEKLAEAGVAVEATAFADWRGSLDRQSRDPSSPTYGRWGSYSTSLFLPKDILQEATARSYGSGKTILDVFFPIMRTRALSFIPGGIAMSKLYERLMALAGIRHVEVPELALGMLDTIGTALKRGADYNPFPRLDAHEASLDLWFFEVVKRLNADEKDPFFYRRWLA